MSNSEVVRDFIRSASIYYCDDCLSETLQIKLRQQVNQICNKLRNEGVIKRKASSCGCCANETLINYK